MAQAYKKFGGSLTGKVNHYTNQVIESPLNFSLMYLLL